MESLFPIHQGLVKSAADGRLVMSFRESGAKHTHAVANDAATTRDGKPATLGDLKPGDHVKVTSEGLAGIRAVTRVEEHSAVFNGYPLEETKA